MTETEHKLYSLICRYYIAQFLGEYEYTQRKVMVKCADNNFVASQNTMVQQGYRLAIGQVMDEKKENDMSATIPALTMGDATQTLDAQCLDKQTKAPPRYTEGMLIVAMKNIAKTVDDAALKKILQDTAGIGTEATRASIIELLLKRGYLVKAGKYVLSTAKGREVLTKCPELLKNPATTAQWEQMLNDIASGNATLDTFLTLQQDALKSMLTGLDALYERDSAGIAANDDTDDNQHHCPTCRKPMAQRKGKHGVFWSCTGYPNCMTTMADNKGAPVVKKSETASRHDCPTCQSNKLVKRKGKKGFFWGCSGYPTCRAIFWDNNNRPNFDNLPKARGAA